MGVSMTQEPSVDTDDQADEVWLLSTQRKLYQWSEANPDGCYRELWNWVTDLRNLRCAWRQIASNRGARTAGVDGKTVGRICATMGREAFLQELRDNLRTGRYQPSPCRRKWIPKSGKPGQFRPLSIPTVTDRLVQGAIKNLLEPIFEATFWHVSYGFRPGRGCHAALEHIRMAIRPRAKASDGRRQRAPYQWVIEGDIKGCFDHIDHRLLMQRVRMRIGDRKVTRVVGQQTTGLELSPEKTRVTDLCEGFEFLGHRVRLKWHHQFGLMPRIEIPKHKQADLRHRVKQETRRDSLPSSLTDRLQRINRLLHGWGNFYRFCTGAGTIFNHLDHYVGDRLWRWLMKKHKGLRRQRTSLRRQRSLVRPTCVVWREGTTEQFLLRTLCVQRFRRGWMLSPRFASVPGEPDA